MKKSTRIVLFVMAMALAVLAEAAGPMPHGGRAKKYVAFAWEFSYLLPEDFLEHAAEFEKTPLDGVGINVNADPASGRRFQCFREIMQAPRWTHAMLANMVEPMRKMATHKCFRESFVGSLRQPKTRLNWTDDAAWDVVSNNLRAVTWLAREGNFRGISMDVEDYTRQSQFNRVDGDLPYDELTKVARRRAQDIFRGIFEEYPNVTIFSFWLFSDAPFCVYETDLPGLMRERADLWPAFVNGILDVLPPTAKLVDGCENAYKFEAARHDFLAAYNRIFNWDDVLVEPENRTKYRTQVSVSFGQYLDMYINNEKASWYFGPVEGSRLKHFRQNLAEATSACDEYVWFWGERGAWIKWCDRLRKNPERLHGGALNTIWDEGIPGGLNTAFKCIKDPDGEYVPRIEAVIRAGKLKDMLDGYALMHWNSAPAKDKNGQAQKQPGRFYKANGEWCLEGLPKSSCYHANFEGLKGNETYYVTGWRKGKSVTAGAAFMQAKRWIYGRKNSIPAEKAGADGWQRFSGFVKVPEYADCVSFSFGTGAMKPDETASFRDLHIYKLP